MALSSSLSFKLQVFLLSPILAVQAIWVGLKAPRFPEADGPRSGRAGSGKHIRMLIVGDSSSVGVGMRTQSDALSGHLERAFSTQYSVTWKLLGKNGATAATLGQMLQTAPKEHFDIAVVALGVNDVKNGYRVKAWQKNYQNLVRELRSEFGVQIVIASGVPPMGRLKLVPNPLRKMLGLRAQMFDDVLSEMARTDEAVYHIKFDIELTSDMLAADGFHPGAPIYKAWATRIHAACDAHFASCSNSN